MKFKIEDWYGILPKPYSVELKPGYTALVGPNGAGKSTFLSQIRAQVEKLGFPCLKFDYDSEGRNMGVAAYEAEFGSGFGMLATAVTSSEGERITIQFGKTVRKIGEMVAAQDADPEHGPLFVLLDALDSGASIDRVVELRKLFDLIISDARDNVYLVVAGNDYELVSGNADCVDPRTGEHVSFDDYESFRSFITGYPLEK